MKKFPRFSRQIGKTLIDFPMLEVGDTYLIPIDTDYSHLSLVAFMQLKNHVINNSKPMNIIYFYSTEKISNETTEYLNKFCQKRKIEYSSRKILAENRESFKKILIDTAIELNCNKIVLPDSLDFLDATILSNMSFEGVFSGISVIENILIDDKKIKIIRPFCCITDDEIQQLGQINNFPNNPTGVTFPEDDNLKLSRKAIQHLLDGTSNIKMNFFNAQFNVQKKYIGIGEGESEAIPFTEDIEI